MIVIVVDILSDRVCLEHLADKTGATPSIAGHGKRNRNADSTRSLVAPKIRIRAFPNPELTGPGRW
jgi:hypothetical protein